MNGPFLWSLFLCHFGGNLFCYLHIIHLSGEDSRYDGATGVVTHIDDMGQLHGTWGGLAVIPEEDDFVVEG